MSQHITTMPAPAGQVYEPSAFDHLVGELMPVTAGGRHFGAGTVSAVEVAEDGKTAWITVDFDAGHQTIAAQSVPSAGEQP